LLLLFLIFQIKQLLFEETSKHNWSVNTHLELQDALELNFFQYTQ